MKRYLKNILVGLDQLLNTLLNGSPDETVSARAGRNASKWQWHWLAAILNGISSGHTDRAIKSEQCGEQQNAAYGRSCE